MQLKKQVQRNADLFTGICMAASIFPLAWYVVGPKTGMESPGIIVPLLISGAVHLFLGLPALWFAFASGSFLRNTWIFAYFIVIAWFVGGLTGANVHLEKKFAAQFHSAEYELYRILEPMALTNRPPRNEDTANIQKALAFVQQGAEPRYVYPGDNRNLVTLAISADVPEVAMLMFAKTPDLLQDTRTMYALMRRAISFGRVSSIQVLLDTGVAFPLEKFKDDLKGSHVFRAQPERLKEMYLRFNHHYPVSDTEAKSPAGL